MHDYNQILKDIASDLADYEIKGAPASYIPELAKVDSSKFGVHLACADGTNYACGESEQRFSIQSISKVISLAVAYTFEGKDLWKRVGVEPSGSPFNSLVQLEYEQGIPRNPFINAGALVICDVLVTRYKNPKKDFLKFLRLASNIPDLDYSFEIARSEQDHGYRNAALINLMKDFGNIKNDVNEVLDFYFHLCSLKMNCREIAQLFLFMATHGKTQTNPKIKLTTRQSKRMISIMQTCGFYDEAGEFAFKVGLAGKSGVGGGIVAILPGEFSIAVWSPPLNPKGNSEKGMLFLEKFTTLTESSLF